MSIAYVFFTGDAEIACRHDISQDTFLPSLLNFQIILQLKVLYDMARRYLNYFNDLMLQDEHFACEQVYLKNHLIRHSMDILHIEL